jgi:hypothetical protein
MNVEKMFNVRANNTVPTSISSDGEFYYNFIDYIRNNSKILNQSIIVEGNPQQNYYFDIENTSNNVYEGEVKSKYKQLNSFSCIPKVLVYEFGIDKNSNKVLLNINENKEKQILENVIYKPFLRSVEKNVINGNYFDKSILLSTDIFTGTNDFISLLKFIRLLKIKNENNVIIVNPEVMNDIIDTITIESYLTEYLLNKTIEGIRIIESLECIKTDIFGIDPTKICLVIYPELQIKKLSLFEFPTEYIYHIYSFVNGGDIFNSGYRMRIV